MRLVKPEPKDPPLPPVNDAHMAGIWRNIKNIAIEINKMGIVIAATFKPEPRTPNRFATMLSTPPPLPVPPSVLFNAPR